MDFYREKGRKRFNNTLNVTYGNYSGRRIESKNVGF